MRYVILFTLFVLHCFAENGRVLNENKYMCNNNGNVGGNNSKNWDFNYNVDYWTGELEVMLKVPEKTERYEIELINVPVPNATACEQSLFDDDSKTKVHTLKRVIRSGNVTMTGIPSCQDGITMWYDWIFTGCYALRLTNDDEIKYLRPMFLSTAFNYSDFSNPYFLEKTYITTDEDPAGAGKLIIDITYMPNIEISKGNLMPLHRLNDFLLMKLKVYNTCNRHPSDFPIANCSLYYNNATRDCNGMEEYIVTNPRPDVLETNRVRWEIGVFTNISEYSVSLSLDDEKSCERALWHRKFHVRDCYVDECLYDLIDGRKRPFTEPPKEPKTDETTIFIAVFITANVIGVAVFIYWLVSRGGRTREFSEQQELFESNSTSVEKLGSIMLMYARDSPQFMEKMANFRDTLKRHCHCDVYDWYASSDCNKSEKAQQMLITGKRVVWVDTQQARNLIIPKSKKNRSDKRKPQDFRDDLFPYILDVAKCTLQNPTNQYRNHFVVRFEKFTADERTDDPFADLSPNARYLMDDHLENLCTDLMTTTKMKKMSFLAQEAREEEAMNEKSV